MVNDLHAQGEKIRHALEGRLLADGKLHGDDAVAETNPKFLHHSVKVCVLAIHLVHEKGPRQAQILAESPRLFRLHLDARRSGNDNESAVRRRQCAPYIPYEIRIPRGIDEIELESLPFRYRQGVADGHFTLGFLLLVIQYAGAVIHFPQSLDGACIEQAGFQEARLPGLSVSDHCHVANVRALVLFHA